MLADIYQHVEKLIAAYMRLWGINMLYIENLTKQYGSFTAVKNLTLHIPEGDLFGFVGPNGAGKTTTIRIVCGLPKEGSHGV